MAVVDRYFIREVLRTLAAVLLVLLLIFLSNRLVRYFAEAASGALPADVITVLISIKAVSFLVLLVPLALFLAILLVLGRWYRDQEMAALTACGMSIARLFRPALLIALPLALLLAVCSLWLMPRLAAVEFDVLAQARARVDVAGLAPGRFREARGGGKVFYVERVADEGRTLIKVFIHARRAGRSLVVDAERGRIEVDPEGGRWLVLENGRRYEGEPGAAELRVTEFRRHALRLPAAATAARRIKRTMIPTSELLDMADAREVAELQWRIAVPLAAVLSALLAVPMARVRPRHGMYARLLAGVLLYILYSNLLALAQAWTEQGRLPAWLGLWWVHGGVALILFFGTLGQLRPRWWRYLLR